jgi:hypothetical protein
LRSQFRQLAQDFSRAHGRNASRQSEISKP